MPLASQRCGITPPVIASLAMLIITATAQAQPTTFTYQGKLSQSGVPFDGTPNMTFRLWDSATGGTQIGSPLTFAGTIPVTNGLFTATLDFGANAFNGSRRWLEVTVNNTVLSPRQEVTSAPYAQYAGEAATLNLPYSGAANTSGTTFSIDDTNTNGTAIYGLLGSAALPFPSTLTAAIRGDAPVNHAGVAGVTDTGIGLYGYDSGASGYGLYARADGALGTAVFGTNVAGGWAGAFVGKVYVDGNLGIAVPFPAFPITLSDVVGDKIALFGQSGAHYGIGVQSALLQIHTNISAADIAFGYGSSSAFIETMRIKGTGNVGINTSSPGALLHANGGVSNVGLFAGNLSPFGNAGIETNFSAAATHAWLAENGTRVFSVKGGGAGYFAGNVGIGTTSQGAKLDARAAVGANGVYGQAGGATGTSINGNAGVWGDSSSGAGVAGTSSASGAGYGVLGSSTAIGGIGVRGDVTASSGINFGGYFTSGSPGGTGIFGQASATSGTTYAGRFEDFSTDGTGVFGYASATTGSTIGVYGRSDSGTGVSGFAGATSGTTYGGYFESDSASGYGVYGVAHSGGVGAGVYGTSFGTNGNGVVGESNFDTSAYGVWGKSTTGYAGYFNGRVNVTGTLSKGGGSFKIDHPLDPENKYLYHSFVESPDMKNVYDGVATTDAKGYVTVTLPAWFEVLNRDFRYQLTIIDAGADGNEWVLARAAREVRNNQFAIRTSRPNTKVSWQLTGTRHDAFANAHRIPVEEEKRADERGLYLYPTEHGQPLERGIDHQRSVNLAGVPKRPTNERP